MRRIKGLVRITDRERVVRTLTEAFAQYPKLMKAFPDEDIRKIAVEAALWQEAVYGMKFGGAYALDTFAEEVAIVIPSRHKKTSNLKYNLAGSFSQRYQQANERLSSAEQLIKEELFCEMREMETEISFPKRFLYISFLGVLPKYQRKGKASELMERLSAYSQKKKCPLIMYTNEPKNIPMYQDMGFQVMGITSSKKFQFVNIYLIKK